MKLNYYEFINENLVMKKDEIKKVYENAIVLKKFTLESDFYIPHFLIVSKDKTSAVLFMCVYEGKLYPLPFHGRTPKHLILQPKFFNEYSDDEKSLDDSINQLRIHLKSLYSIYQENSEVKPAESQDEINKVIEETKTELNPVIVIKNKNKSKDSNKNQKKRRKQ